MPKNSRKLKKLLEADNWYVIASNRGRHVQFKHPTKRGRVTLPHPKKDLPIKTVKSIYRQAGWL